MRTIKYKYNERYRGYNIFIYGTSREWLWQVVIDGKATGISLVHCSLKTANNAAKKYIDRKLL